MNRRVMFEGEPCAVVPVEELDEWASLLTSVEDWFLHASDETAGDWAQFTHRGRCSLYDLARELGRTSVHMRYLTGEAP